MKEIRDLVEISKYAGERFDLVQAGGGNSSVKLTNDNMLIKASGFLLSDVNEHKGFSTVITSKIANIVRNEKILNDKNKKNRELISAKLVAEATVDKVNRPSIETLLHSLLLKYTLHTHPIVVNMIAIQKGWKEILLKIFAEEKIALVEYKTPGIDLALTLVEELQKFEKPPNIIFLQNHGLIVTSNFKEDIKILTEKVLEKIERYLNIEMDKFKLTNTISHFFNLLNCKSTITYLCQDVFIVSQIKINKELFFSSPFCPDSLVYCGMVVCELSENKEIEDLKIYKAKYLSDPKIILYKNNLFFVAPTIKKAREIEEVFKYSLMILEKNIKSDKNFLKVEELVYLSNWGAEKFRLKI